MDTLKLQMNYDSKLQNSTRDAVKAFQMNTVNSSTSDLVNSKIRDIEAASNSFFTALSTNFNLVGYNSENLKEYVPALVFTLYDGFYIYSPFENTLDEETKSKLPADATYTDGTKVTGLKPYIYYSCRYKKGSMDVTITYSLDNYITVQGYDKNGKPINDAGYLLDQVSYNGNTVTYRGVNITSEPELSEYIGKEELYYIKINGVKYYHKKNDNNWFTIINGKKTTGVGTFKIQNNDMAYRYYKEAAEFKERLVSYGITELTSSDAVGVEDVRNENGDIIYSFVNTENQKIFDFDGIEEADSNFNDHRLAVIRYVIESNLAVALANYNNYGSGNYEFRMPKLGEEDWGKILNNVSLISFLQGLSIGGKIYNGYSVVNNNKNEEVVTENSIYIIDDRTAKENGTYHRVTHEGLTVNANSVGVFNVDMERKKLQVDANTSYYYYPHMQLGCYTCYVAQTDVVPVSNIYEYLDNHKDLAKVYYTALGRERYSSYKIFNNPEEAIKEYR